MPPAPKFCIYGAGAIGSTIGVLLARAGAEVSVVARGETLAVLEHEGLRLRMDGQMLQAPVHVSADPSELGPQDYVIIAVKAPALPGVASEIAPLLGSKTAVVTAMNGIPWWFFQNAKGRFAGRSLNSIDPDGAIGRSIPAWRAIGCVVHMSCSLEAPGLARHNVGCRLIVGEGSNRITRRISRLAEWLNLAGFQCESGTSIQREIWFKLWGNMTMNPISLLTEATCDRIIDDPLAHDLAKRMMEEAARVGEAIGIRLDHSPEEMISRIRRMGAFKTSMLQDLEHGKPVEIDVLLSATREIGQMAGVPTPFIDSVLGLARLKATGLGLHKQAA
jgi:2-dehydropantoate 2-reductase